MNRFFTVCVAFLAALLLPVAAFPLLAEAQNRTLTNPQVANTPPNDRQDSLPKKVPGLTDSQIRQIRSGNDDDILLSLVWFRGRVRSIGMPEANNAPSVVPYIVIWKDGSYLCGKIHGEDETTRPTEFYSGRMEKDKIEEIVNHLPKVFRAKPNASARHMDQTGTYYRLQVRSDEGVLDIMTRAGFDVHFYPNLEIFSADKTKDGTPVLLLEFAEMWKQCKKYLLKLCNELSGPPR